MTYAAHVDARLDGRHLDPAERVEPGALAAVWDSCAFLEIVKCSPAGNRSWPSDAMLETCPSFLLRSELEVLRPRVVILLGRGKRTRDVVRPMLDVTWGESPGSFERDTFTLADGAEATLLSVNHPSTSNRIHWQKSLNQLAASLAARPIPYPQRYAPRTRSRLTPMAAT